MYPILFSIGNFDIRAYWVMAALGIIAGFLVLFINFKNTGLDKKQKRSMLFFAAAIFVPFYIGARLGYLAEHNFTCESKNMFDGFSLWWGLITATLSAFGIAKLLKVNVWLAADIFTPSIALGGAFAKTGCLLNGCCFGNACPETFPLGTFFSSYSAAGSIMGFTALYPVQLFLAAGFLFIFIYLQLNFRTRKFHGEVILAFSIMYSIIIFVVDFFRYYETFFPQTKILAVIIFITGAILYILFEKKGINRI